MNRRDWLRFSAAATLSCWSAGAPLLGAKAKNPFKVILLISGWKDVNIGDITHTTGLLHTLQTHFPDSKIILWKSNMRTTDQKSESAAMIKRHFPSVEIIGGIVNRGNFNMQGDDLHRAVDEADIFVHGSGPSVVRWDALAAWSKRTDKPFGIFGTTIQDIAAPLKSVLEKASFIYPRETASIEVLKEHGFEGERIMFVPDATFDLRTRDEETALNFLNERKLKDRQFICVIPRLRWTPYPGRMEKNPPMQETNDRYKEIDHAKAREAIIAWAEKTKLPVLVCPEMTYQVDIMDELLIDPLPQSIKPYVQKRGYWMPDEAASVYARAHTVLSFECHSPIIATAMGTPAFYLRQPEDTIKGQMYYDLGMADWTFELEQSTGRQIADRLLEVATDYPQALDKVKAVNAKTAVLYAQAAARMKALRSS